MLYIAGLPDLPGSYVLRLRLAQPLSGHTVGRLGVFDFPAGEYLYLGSARGPGGLRARLAHHERITAHPHWHLDWLRPHGVLSGGWLAVGSAPLECSWSQALLALLEAAVPAPGFGAADCRRGCPAHLFRLQSHCQMEVIEQALRRAAPDLTAF